MPAANLIGWMLIVIGGGVALTWWRLARQARATRQWPSTSGVVLRGELRTLISVQAYVLSQGGLHPRAEPRIEYAYQVDGQIYRSDRVRLGTYSLSGREAAQVLRDHAPGRSVAVYYDPRQPARAILQMPAGGAWSGIAVGAGCLVIGAILLLVR